MSLKPICIVCLCCLPLTISAFTTGVAEDNRVAFVITRPPADLQVPEFYSKFISVDGYPIVSSANVSDYALKEAAFLIQQMLAGRPELRSALIRCGSRLCILGYQEFTTDLPEFASLPLPADFSGITARDYWDARARGTGGSADDPFCSCGEENLLGYPGDPYAAESILIHEFGHNIHLRGMPLIDASFDHRVRAAYDDAMEAGLWKGKYASVNHHEYFAEGVQSWFDNNRENDTDHNHVNTRAELLDYDPALAELCREIFGDSTFSYSRPVSRLHGHMAGYVPEDAPGFEWPERLRAAQQLIRRHAERRAAQQ